MRMKRQGLLALFASMAWAQPLPHPGQRVTCQSVESADVTVSRAAKPPRTLVGVLRSVFNAHFNVGIHIGSQLENTQALVSVTYGRRVPRNKRELYYEEGFFLRYSKATARRSPKTYLTTVHYDDQWPRQRWLPRRRRGQRLRTLGQHRVRWNPGRLGEPLHRQHRHSRAGQFLQPRSRGHWGAGGFGGFRGGGFRR